MTLDVIGMWFGTNTDVTEQREADRRKDEFLATLAHELRNPLAPIRNALQRDASSPATDRRPWRRRATIIERQVAQMVRLVDDLLDVSRITRGKIELQQRAMSTIDAVVRSAVETGRPLIERRGHELDVALPDRAARRGRRPDAARPGVREPAQQRRQVHRAGRAHRASRPTEARISGRVSVKDDGIGIPPRMLAQVFDMFTQVDRSLERSQGGLGIGLALVERLVEMHGGTVEAQSDGPGHGQRVRRAAAARSGSHEPHRRRAARAGDATAGQPVTTDAGASWSSTTTRPASTLALHAGAARPRGRGRARRRRGAGGVAATSADVVLLDIGMPRTERLRDLPRISRAAVGRRSLVIIALTGWGQDDDRRRSTEAGFDLHLVKPLDPALLESLLRDLASEGGADDWCAS